MYPFSVGSFAVRNAWYVAALSSEIGRTPVEQWYLDEPVVLYRRQDGVAVALGGRCPHRQFPLAAGRLGDDDVLVCGYHGIAFASDGRCVKIPTQDRVPPGFGVRRFPLAERWQWLWIWMGDPDKADESLIPDHAAIGLGNPGQSSVPMFHHLVNGRYQLLHDNLLDLSHLTFLHSTGIGMAEIATTNETVEAGDSRVRTVRDVRGAEPSPITRARCGEVKVDFLIDFTFHAPSLHVGINTTRLAQGDSDEPGEVLIDSIVYHAVTPATRHTSHYFFARTQIVPDDEDGQAATKAAAAKVIDEDIFATVEIERMLAGSGLKRDLLTRGDVAVSRGRAMLQAMMDAERAP